MVIGNKNDKEKFSYVIQLAFDPVKMKWKEKEKRFSLNTFSGHIVKASWEEEIDFALKYENGKYTRTLTTGRNARVSGCITYYITTAWYSQASVGGYTGTPQYMHTSTTVVTVCDHPALDDNLFTPIINFSSNVMLPDATYVYNPPSVFPDPCDLVNYPSGPNGALAKTNLENVLNSFGTGFSIQSLTWDGGIDLARAMGGTLLDTKVIQYAGRTIAGLGAVTSIGTFVIGISDGSGFTWDYDGKNLLLAALGIGSVLLTFTPAAPIYAVGVSAAALVIGFIPAGDPPCLN